MNILVQMVVMVEMVVMIIVTSTEVHWGTFGEKQKALVQIAVQKMHLREKEFSKESLREELDIGPKVGYATDESGFVKMNVISFVIIWLL